MEVGGGTLARPDIKSGDILSPGAGGGAPVAQLGRDDGEVLEVAARRAILPNELDGWHSHRGEVPSQLPETSCSLTQGDGYAMLRG